MRAKAIAIFLTVVIALLGVSTYQVGRGVKTDQLTQGEASARSQMAALIPAFQGEFNSINQHYKVVAPEIFAKLGDFSETVSNRFEMIAKMQLANGAWTISQRAFQNKSNVKSWAENYTQVALKAIKPKDIPMGGTALTALLDPQRRPFFLWIMRDEKDQWACAITKTDVFQAILDRQRGQTLSIFLVNKSGQAIGHTTNEYVGTILREDPVVSEISRTGNKMGKGTFTDKKGDEVQGYYELLPGTNVFVVLSRPLATLNDNVSSLRMQILLLGGGLALLGLAALLLLIRDGGEGSVPYVPVASPGLPPMIPSSATGYGGVTSAGASGFAAVGTGTATGTSSADVAREKMKAYTLSASALAREMHSPLTRILSQAQLLKAKKINDEEVTRIEELAREGRAIVLKLLSFAGEEDFKAEATSLNEVLNRTLGIFENRFQSKGIKVEKNLKRMPDVMAHPLALMKVFEAILTNSIEAMERMSNKQLTLTLEPEGDSVVCRIKDSGEGLSPEKTTQVFDPFFTTKGQTQHSGLGLSTAYGLVREFGGEIQFQSQPGQGSTVTIRFPVGQMAVKSTPSVSPSVAPSSGPMAAPPIPAPVTSGLAHLMNSAPVPSASPSSVTPAMGVGAVSAGQPPRMAPPSSPPTSPPTSSLASSQNPTVKPMPGGSPSPSGLAAPRAPVNSTPAPSAKPPPGRAKPVTVEPANTLNLDLNLDFNLDSETQPALSRDFTATTPPQGMPPSTFNDDATKAPLAPLGGPVIQDRALEETLNMIENVEPVKPAQPPSQHPSQTGFGKIDKPTLPPKKAPVRVAPAGVTIRKPGERK